MTTSQKLTLGPLVHSHMLGDTTPQWIIAEGITFTWVDHEGYYPSDNTTPPMFLYMEEEIITPDTPYEILPV